MSVRRTIQTWIRRWRWWLHHWGSIGVVVVAVWMIVASIVACTRRAVSTLKPSRGTPSRRRNPPGWHKKRMAAFAENRRRNNGMLRCEQYGFVEGLGDRSFHWHHIQSWKWWPKARDYSENMAVRCSWCNLGASNRYHTKDLKRFQRKLADQRG